MDDGGRRSSSALMSQETRRRSTDRGAARARPLDAGACRWSQPVDLTELAHDRAPAARCSTGGCHPATAGPVARGRSSTPRRGSSNPLIPAGQRACGTAAPRRGRDPCGGARVGPRSPSATRRGHRPRGPALRVRPLLPRRRRAAGRRSGLGSPSAPASPGHGGHRVLSWPAGTLFTVRLPPSTAPRTRPGLARLRLVVGRQASRPRAGSAEALASHIRPRRGEHGRIMLRRVRQAGWRHERSRRSRSAGGGSRRR